MFEDKANTRNRDHRAMKVQLNSDKLMQADSGYDSIPIV